MSIPKMQDLYSLALFIKTVEDQDRGVDKLPDVPSAWDWLADLRKARQEIHMIENCHSETRGRIWKVGPRVFDQLLELG